MNALDKDSVDSIRKLILNLKQNVTIILTSHNKEDIDIFYDEVYEIENGRLQIVNK